MNPVIHFWLKSRKVRGLESQKVRESQGTLLKKLGGNPVQGYSLQIATLLQKRLSAEVIFPEALPSDMEED